MIHQFEFEPHGISLPALGGPIEPTESTLARHTANQDRIFHLFSVVVRHASRLDITDGSGHLRFLLANEINKQSDGPNEPRRASSGPCGSAMCKASPPRHAIGRRK